MPSLAARSRGLAWGLVLLAGCGTPGVDRNLVADPEAPLAAGCWLNAYRREEYRPPLTTFTGPSYGRFISRDTRSLALGPAARLTAYAAPPPAAPLVTIGPGERLPDLDAIDFHGRVHTFGLSCVP